MADLITRLLLETGNFDNNLGKSSKQIKDFEVEIQDFSGKAVGYFSKFAGGIGAAITVGEAFNKTMQSNQTTSDLLENSINAAKDSVDNFFYALGTGDWSSFRNGLLAAYKDAFNLSNMVDDLNDKILSLTYINAKDSAEMAKWEEIARDTTKSAKERKEAIKNLQKAQDDLVRSVGSTDKSKMNVMLTGLNDKTGLKYSRNDIENFVANTNFNGGKQAEEYKKVYKNYTLLSQSMNNKYDTRSVRERENVLNNYKKQNEYAIKQGHLLEQNDKQRKAMVNTLIEINNGEQQIYQTQQRINKVSRTINKTDQPKTTKVTVKPEVDEKAATGSLAELDQQLTEWKTKFNNAATYEARVAADKMIKELETKKILLKVEVTYGKASDLKKLTDGSIPTIPTIKSKNPNEALNDIIKPIDTSTIDSNYNYADSLTTIGSIMSSITNNVGSGAAAWLSWGANLASAVATAIPQILALTVAKKAQATAEVKVAAAEAGSSAAKIPVVGWVAAIAAIAAVFAVMLSAPSFSTGGILTGNSFVGDNMIAKVNSGEMILNSRQQRNLFNLLDGNTGNSFSNGKVEFKIAGKELIGVLNNYSSKINKYK